MKKFVSLLLLCALLLCACSPSPEDQPEGNFSFYYRAAKINYGEEDGVIAPQAVEVDLALPIKELVEQYLAGPTEEGLASAVPESWSLHVCYLDEQMAVLFFNDSGETDPLTKSVANACIAKTLLQLERVERVSITMLGQAQTQVLTEHDVLLRNVIVSEMQEDIVLYFPNEEGSYLHAEKQSVPLMDPEEKPVYIMQELLSRKEGDKLRSGIPEGTKLLGISVENGVCTLDLSAEFLDNMECSFKAERMAVYSIVNSLTQLPEIETVDFWISGAPLERLAFLDLSAGIVRDEPLIAESGAEDLLDVTIYPIVDRTGQLAPIHRKIDLSLEESPERQALKLLLSYSDAAGISTPVPKGTQLLSAHVEGGICTVDFTGELLDNCANDEQRLLAIRAVVATLTDFPEIDAVEIFVEGIAPAFLDDYPNRLRLPSRDWFVE